MSETRTYPRDIALQGRSFTLRGMVEDDKAGILAFARALPSTDLLFLRRDITHPRVVAAWLRDIVDDTIVTLLAIEAGKIVGCAAIVTDPLSWSKHVGELRILVSSDVRGAGLGRALAQEAFAVGLERGLEKFVAQMTPDQQGALAMFSGLGFRPEALLRDHVKDRDGTTHDIVILSHDVARVSAQHEAMGLNEAF